MIPRTRFVAFATTALLTTATSITLGGQFNPYRGVDRDVLVGDPIADGRTNPVVLNGDFGVSFVTRSGDPVEVASAVRVYDAPVRTNRRHLDRLPIGFDHSLPIDGPLELDTTFDSEDGSMGIAPTPGAMALLGVGGLGLVSRRGN